jgi:multicomponent Na+:H+ antiporter subunit D
VISPHLPVLQVVVPLLSAPLCVLFRSRWPAWGLALAASWVSFAIALSLLAQVLGSGPISYDIGDWAPPWGIEYRVDIFSAFVLTIVSGIGSMVMLYAPKSVAREVPADRVYLFYTMYLLCLAGLLGITVTGDAFNLFVFLEISSLSSYVLISLGTERRALTAAYRYLVLGTIGATFYVIGVGLMYQTTGTLNMADLAQRLPPVGDSLTIVVAIGFLTVGIGLKLGLFPLHLWLPNAYTYAPSVVSAFLAATATKVAVYVLVRIYFTVLGPTIFAAMPMAELLRILAIVAMLAMSAVAIFQTNAKRLLAYSSVAQIGYMILGVSFVTVTGLTAGLIHIFNHALMKAALFLVMGCIFLRIRSVRIDDMAGLGRAMPFTMAAFVVGGLSLIGIPATTGFVSKWYLVLAALENHWWWLAALVLISSLLAIAYVWRIVEVAYFRPRPDGAVEAREAPAIMLIPVWLLAAANIYFGIDASRTVDIAQRAAEALLGGGP